MRGRRGSFALSLTETHRSHFACQMAFYDHIYPCSTILPFVEHGYMFNVKLFVEHEALQ